MSTATPHGALSVEPLGAEGEDAWRAFVQAQPRRSLYNTASWRDILRRSYGFEPVYLVALRNDRVVESLPLFSIRHPLLRARKLVSTPFSGWYSTFLSEDREAKQALVARAVQMARDQRARYLEIRTADALPWLEELGFVVRRPLCFPELPLQDRESNLKRMAAAHRRAIRRARAQGLVVSRSDRIEDLQAFYRILQDLFQGFGSPALKYGYYEAMWQELGPKDEFALLVARHADRIVGAGVFFFYNGKVIYKNGVCTLESLPLRPYNALLWHALEMGLERGMRHYNLGATSPADTGLLRFKQQWGAEPKEPFFYYLPVAGRFPEIEDYFDSYAWQKAVWRRLPRPLVDWLGPRITEWVC